jgi:hypothetical protein
MFRLSTSEPSKTIVTLRPVLRVTTARQRWDVTVRPPHGGAQCYESPPHALGRDSQRFGTRDDGDAQHGHARCHVCDNASMHVRVLVFRGAIV